MHIKARTGLWMVLLLLTLATFAIGEVGMTGRQVVFGLLGVTLLKGHLVIDHFMDLRRVEWLWRGLVHGWLLLVLGLIAIAY
ncbi:cytochrome C oxidase subunit IV family protein [Chitinivorax sp. B]|uniref:cytochrome C oxidase subunit IV family protein n=1 Tax=Chitinivorax sp. B TaxID=2502235 RepID=UPI0010F901B1|nr:cytochrome C oxidase subunit IV family protein [Chitinivorax sp. B]